jgi:hypothetical protein
MTKTEHRAASRLYSGIGQGRNRISLSRQEAYRLIELMSGDGGNELRYTSTTPAKETAK